MNSLIGNTCAQLFTDGKYIYIHYMKINKEDGDGLKKFTDDVSITNVIMRENSGEQNGHNTEFMKLMNKYCIGDRTVELYSPCNNTEENLL